MGQQPDPGIIDRHIRGIVYMLNEVPYIQTLSSCSGHPDDPSSELSSGFITLEPVGDMRAFWEFLNGLHVKLNSIDGQMLEHFQRVGAETLCYSGLPLIHISFDFMLYVTPQENNRMELWGAAVSKVQAFLGMEERPIKTPEEGASSLIRQLHSTPYVAQESTRQQGDDVHFQAAWNYESCQWCFSFVEGVNAILKRDLASEGFRCHGNFMIRTIDRGSDVQRTRGDMLKIWGLIESAVVQLYPSLGSVVLPQECILDASIEAERQAIYLDRLRKHIQLENLCRQAQKGDVQAYQLLYDETKQIISEVLGQCDIEQERKSLEEEILSRVMSSLHHFNGNVFFRTWVRRIAINVRNARSRGGYIIN